MGKVKKVTEQTQEAVKFSKQQLLTSKRYKHRVDLVNALLDENAAYSTDEVDALIEKYLKGKVM